ncbi:porin family protein [Aquimarina intermedia]|uniref:TonB dependent receptor n=1 Tax=Aquimarina intermedia TaxID=350814 RepID=A0A5S5BVG7_9FLAO|nr:TonB-dependent receptor [Aquimarina intermedia]TYP70979.1 TonB dependent receptor [Aquimarina intermedia]
MSIHKLLIISTCAVLYTFSLQAQEEKDKTIETDRVIVVKAYTPTISDAFKVKTIPKLGDSATYQKKELRYNIFSVPVASTFTPAKGRAADIERPKGVELYDNYATLGFGNYTSVLAEFYSNFQINRTDNFGMYLHHNSSQGGIENVALDDKFYNSFLDLNYTSRTKDFTYGFEAGIEHQIFNWYGLPENNFLTEDQILAINPEQTYYGAKVGGKLIFNDAILDKAILNYRFFGDATESSEHHVNLEPTITLDLGDQKLQTVMTFDYLNGSFEDDPNPNNFIETGIKYSRFITGINPNLIFNGDNFTLNLGASIFYSMDIENEENDFFIYPNVTASYRLLDDAVIVYAALEGELKQNTYRDAVQDNPYVSPTLTLQPTNKQYEGYLGFKGRVSDIFSYNVKGGYASQSEVPLFFLNTAQIPAVEAYDYGNSFAYRYDDLTTAFAYAELNFDINTKFKLSTIAEYFDYDTTNEVEAWNLPSIKASLRADYQITDAWYAGAQMYFVGERMDIVSNTPLITKTLDSYIDVNANLGYRFNDQLSAFIKGYNLIGDNYERWSNYPVQGIQVLGGITYKFNY